MEKLLSTILLTLMVCFPASIFSQKYTGLTALASDGTTPQMIFNNNTTGARWQDAHNLDTSWLRVDLGEALPMSNIRIYWEAANALEYYLAFSLDGDTWFGQIDFANMPTGNRTDNIPVTDVTARYIKMQGVKRQLPYGYSIFEFEVFAPVEPKLSGLKILPSAAVINFGQSQLFEAQGLDQLGNPIGLTETTIWSVIQESGASINDHGLFEATAPGIYTIKAENETFSATVQAEVKPENPNVAIGKSATASTGNAAPAIDGNSSSRWESASTDPQWIIVDLKRNHFISDMIIHWEGANAKNYMIEMSLDGDEWELVAEKENMPSGGRHDRMYGLDLYTRFLRLTGTQRNTQYGYSIWEWMIHGVSEEVLVESIVVTAPDDVAAITLRGATLQLSALVLPEDADNKTVTWSITPQDIAKIDENGLVTALDNGTVFATATANGASEVSGEIEIIISNQDPDPELAEIYITPTDAILDFGATLEFEVHGKDQFGNPIDLTEPTIWSVEPSGATISQDGLFEGTAAGVYIIEARYLTFTATVQAEVKTGYPNVAIGKTATSSTGNATQAIDGNLLSRWESASEDPQWIMVDLGRNYFIYDMSIQWETANAKQYSLERSLDGEEWTLVTEKENMHPNERIDKIYGLDLYTRYLRLNGIERNTTYGYSIWEWMIHGVQEEILVESISIKATNDLAVISEKGGTLQLTAVLMPLNADKKDVVWSLKTDGIASIDQNGLVTAISNGTVVVVATSTDGSQVSGEIELTITNQDTSVYNEHTDFRVYPNPATDYVFVVGTGKMSVFNIMGHMVIPTREFSTGEAINLSELEPGIYFIVAHTPSGIMKEKVVIRKNRQ